MSEIIYRNAVIDDISNMHRLWREFWPEQPYESNLKRKIGLDPDLVYVAEIDRQIIGTIIGGFDGWWGWIYRIAVMPKYQNKGIATKLIREMQTRLKARGAKSANAIVSSLNKRMHHVLEKLGYGEREDKRLFLKL